MAWTTLLYSPSASASVDEHNITSVTGLPRTPTQEALAGGCCTSGRRLLVSWSRDFLPKASRPPTSEPRPLRVWSGLATL